MARKFTCDRLSKSDTAIKMAIIELAAKGQVAQNRCIEHILNKILDQDGKCGISVLLSPHRVGLKERVANCCEALFAADIIVALNEREFTLTTRGRRLHGLPVEDFKNALQKNSMSDPALLHLAGRSLPAGSRMARHRQEGFAVCLEKLDHTDNP